MTSIPLYHVMFMYTTLHWVVLLATLLRVSTNVHLHRFVGANTVLIALLVTYVGWRTKWRQFPSMYDHVVGSTFTATQRRIAHHLFDFMTHYLPLFLVTIPFDASYYVGAFVTYTIWYIIVRTSGTFASTYTPIPLAVIDEAWVFGLLFTVLMTAGTCLS
jgi:hypothetical protein